MHHLHQCGRTTFTLRTPWGCGHVWKHSPNHNKTLPQDHMCPKCGKGPWYVEITESKPVYQTYCEWLKKIEYKPGWRLSLATVWTAAGTAIYFIQWQFDALCIRDKIPVIVSTRKEYLWENITETEFCDLAFSLIMVGEMHEAKEHFLYAGARVNNPHMSVHARHAMADIEDASRNR